MYSIYHLYGAQIYFREKDSKTYNLSLSIRVGVTNGVQGMFCKENGICTFLAYLDDIKTLTAYEINPYSKNVIQLG